MENGWVFEDAGQRKKAEVVCGGWEKEGGCGNLSSAATQRSSDPNQFPIVKT
jgi:hypothetical protein